MAKIVINDNCFGCGACAGSAGDVFEVVDNKSKVKDGFDYDSASDEVKANVDAAIAGCPVSAIELVNE